MIPAVRCAELAEAIYDPASKWDREWTRGDVRVGGALIDGAWLTVWRGTEITDIRDVGRDFDCLPPYDDRDLGAVHRGFGLGMLSVAEAIDDDLQGLVVNASGHSLGAAMSLLYAARRRKHELRIEFATTFAPPKIAWAPFGEHTIVQGLLDGLPGTDFAHADDPVPRLPPLFNSGRPLTMLAWTGAPSLDPIAYHGIDGYRADVAALAG